MELALLQCPLNYSCHTLISENYIHIVSCTGLILNWSVLQSFSADCRPSVSIYEHDTGLTLGLHPANERRRYKVTPSLIGWVQT